MTTHLSPQECVNALGGKDGSLPAARQSHLDACASCHTQVAELRALMAEADEGAGMPEPSPLFWDHFHARVLTAVQGEGQPTRHAWWMGLWDVRTLMAVSGAVVAVVASVALYMNRPVTPAADALADSGEVVESSVLADASTALDPLVETGVGNDEWEFVSSVMGGLEGDDIHEVLTPSRDAVDAAFESLTTAERDRFVALLKAELGRGLE